MDEASLAATPDLSGGDGEEQTFVTFRVAGRARLGLPVRDAKLGMGVTVEHRGELYTLLVDRIGDIVCPRAHATDDEPPLGAVWRGVTSGVHRLDDGLVVALDLDRLLDFS